MHQEDETVGVADWEGVQSAWNLYVSSIEVWMKAASNSGGPMPAEVDVDHLIHAAIAAHNAWSTAFSRVIQATHHH